MATRDLSTNSLKAFRSADKIISFTSNELIKSYKASLVAIRSELSVLYEQFLTLAEPTKAQLTQFMRLSNIEKKIVDIMRPFLTANEAFIKDMSVLGVDNGYYVYGWSVDQAAGLSIGYGQIDDLAVRAVAGFGGDVAVLQGLLPENELTQHAKVLDDAFTNYDKDTVKWISQDIRQGIIQGESASQVASRLQKNGLTKSFNSAMTISRTEIMRSTGMGGQIAYDQARDAGVEINEIWDATLDDRTRPTHGAADGTIKNNETGLFSVAWGDVPGPRRSGQAENDIECRCLSVGEVEGYSPELRRVRDRGLQPYQSFQTWTESEGITVNRFGQKYNFKGV